MEILIKEHVAQLVNSLFFCHPESNEGSDFEAWKRSFSAASDQDDKI